MAGPLSPWFLSAPGSSSHTSCPTAPHPHYGLCWTALSTPRVSSPGPVCSPAPSPSRHGDENDPGQHHFPKCHSVANPLPSPLVIWAQVPEGERERQRAADLGQE